MKTVILALFGMGIFAGAAIAATPASKTNQIDFRYQVPKNAKFTGIYKELKERRVLERLQRFLSPFRLPRKVKFLLAECDGEKDAFYGDNVITICYDLVDGLVEDMPRKTTPGGVAPWDTVVGPFFDTCLHEFAHAIFDLLKVPILGREEDAADQVAAYIYLQLDYAEARRLVGGTVYNYFSAAESDDAAETLEDFEEDFSETHSMPQQRAYNLMCMAFGADTKRFGDVVKKGYLPKNRAETCEEEYEQVQDAFDKLIVPHIDRIAAEEVFAQSWLRQGPKDLRRWRGSRRRR